MHPRKSGAKASASGRQPRVRRHAPSIGLAAWLSSKALDTLVDEDNFLSIQKQLNSRIQKGDENDRGFFESLVVRLQDIEDERATFLLLEVAHYFENVGDPERALMLLDSGLEKSLRFGDLNLQRKAFNNLGNACTRLCDFKNACTYYEKAHRLASCLNDPVYKFASLCNIVSLLQLMGLLNTAKQISLELTAFPDGTPMLDHLHVQNANNGLQLSRATRDLVSARKFDRIALAKVNSAMPVGDTWKAYVHANHAWCLCQDGQMEEAVRVVETAIAASSQRNNSRIDAILLCARATNAIYSADARRIEASRQELANILAKRRLLFLHKEELLRTLVDLHSVVSSVEERRAGMDYLRQLNEHLVNVNHKAFFSKLSSAETLQNVSGASIGVPSYVIPPAILSATSELSPTGNFSQAAVVDWDRHFDERVFSELSTGDQIIEAEKRTRSYCIAEDWAVAADFASEHGYRHCLMVGYLTRFISIQLGFSVDRAVTIEMACRLHDIGKLAINEVTHRAVNAGLMDDYCVVREHAVVGARLLASSSDPLLQLAALVAHHHHEWWNGRGSPDGRMATEIPIEARICAVADNYVSLLLPAGGRAQWQSEAAVNQIVAMSGVQLDPELIEPFRRAVKLCDFQEIQGFTACLSDARADGLYEAKQRLLETANFRS